MLRFARPRAIRAGSAVAGSAFARAAVAAAVLVPLAPAAAQEAAEGERLYRSRCASCHGVPPAEARIAPPLAGVVGRTAGTVEGARYSAAMRASGIVWDDATLDAYLADPRAVVRGTTMTVALRDGDDRTAVIAYLATLAAAN